MSSAGHEFLRRAAEKSADLTHRQIIRRGIDQYNTANDRGRSRFADWEAARQRCYEIKWEALNNLDRYLLEFEQRVKERGGHVFWAENSEEACRYITELATSRGVHKLAKSKSMVAEEIHLATALEKVGIETIETDLGEYIVQLRNEPPYHIVTPAMHLTRKDITSCSRKSWAIWTPMILRNLSLRLAVLCATLFFPLKWDSAARIFSWPTRG
jgi:L-lactate dehydrogenase complex protein LldF